MELYPSLVLTKHFTSVNWHREGFYQSGMDWIVKKKFAYQNEVRWFKVRGFVTSSEKRKSGPEDEQVITFWWKKQNKNKWQRQTFFSLEKHAVGDGERTLQK